MSRGDALVDVQPVSWLAAVRARFVAEPHVLLPLCAANSIGYLPLLTMPWLVGVLSQDMGYSAAGSGAIVTAELSLLAAAAILLGAQIHRVNRRVIALLGAGTVIVSALALVAGTKSIALIGLLGAAGVGCGACSAAGASLVSRSADPVRLTANLWTWTVAWQTVVWFVTPIVVARWGARGLGAVIACGGLAFVPWLRRMPVRAETSATGSRASANARMDLAIVIPMLVCVASFWLRDSVTWSLAERRGSLIGVSEYQLSHTLTAASILGIVGPLAANFLGGRFGRNATLLPALVVIALVMQAIASAHTGATYRAGFLLWTSTSLFAWTYLTELAAAMDAEGRVVAICSGLVFAAGACGPLIGGLVIGHGGTLALPMLIGALSAITLLTTVIVLRGLARRRVP